MATYAIGDVQGCYLEFCDLLEKVHFDPTQDCLWLLGDLVNRGPDSLAVVRLVRSLGDSAKTVLGNHDLHFLAIHIGGHTLTRNDTFVDLLHAEDVDDIASWYCEQPFLVRDDAERLGEADAAAGFLLDGFPRSDVQAAWLNTALEPGGIDLVVSLEVPDGVVIERMLARGRADDTEAAIRRRLDLYEAETAPLMGFYRDLGKVVSVNGHGEEDEVEKRLAEVIDAHLTC